MKNFFKREHSEQYYDSYVPSIKDKFNYQNIESVRRRSVLSCFHAGDEKDFLAYRFDVLSEWMKVNERYVQSFIFRLDKVIYNLCLKEEFNSFELQKLYDLSGIIFAKWRNLKHLIVDFPLYKDELVFYRYEVYSFKNVDAQAPVINENIDFFITTKRIVIGQHLYNTSIEYSQIKNYKVFKHRLVFELKNGNTYEITSENIFVIYVSLERVLKREKIIFN